MLLHPEKQELSENNYPHLWTLRYSPNLFLVEY
jgi:hypothetical protein